MPANRLRSIRWNRRKAYEGMRKRGLSKAMSAKIANAGKNKAARSRMAKKAAATRRRKR